MFSSATCQGRRPAILRISELVRGDGRALYERALASGWEGLIAKQADSAYKSGKRTPDWRKLKIVHEQEFVIGGWTEPRQTRIVLRRAAARRLRKRSQTSADRRARPLWSTSATPAPASTSASWRG